MTSNGRAIQTFYGLASTPPVEKDDTVTSPTYILVHGAWGGAWCWRDVGAELDRRGVAWRAVDLPSSRNGAAPTTGLAEDAAAVAAIADDDGPYVLVAHSYGGAVVSEVASRITGLQRCIYVAALIPSLGESTTDASRRVRVRTLLDDAIEVDGDFLRLNPALARKALYDDCAPEVATWAVDQLSTQTLASFRSPRESPKAQTESIYVRCTNDHAVDPELQQLMSEECDFALSLTSEHSPFLSRPSEFCDAILN
jgi:pimeloyl-ACP methyl ester carboxylesterase